MNLCTLNYSKNVKILIDNKIIINDKSYDNYTTNEIQIASAANKYITVSKSEAQWIKQIVPMVKPLVYYPTQSWWSGQQKQRQIGKFYLRSMFPQKLFVIYIGRLTYQKGVQNLFAATLPKNIHLIMMSSTSFSDENLINQMQNYAHKNRDNFTWIGPSYHQDKYNIIQQCDAVICPSIFEPFGLVGLETMLFTDTPLIASSVDGMLDYLSFDGYINCGTTVSQLNQALLIFSTMSNETKQRIAEKGRHYAQKCINEWVEHNTQIQIDITLC